MVATPIGNLSDITERARGVLEQADCILAEDTRHTGQLLRHLNIQNTLVSLHEHNERERVASVIERLTQGEHVALVSDAGTPTISDPGFIVTRAVREAGYAVTPIVGASAIIAALSVAGLPTHAFIFDGFLPAKSQARQAQLARYQHETRTVVLYESSHRILATLNDIVEVLGAARTLGIARELTKRFETVLTGHADSLYERVSNDANQQKGEFVLMIQGVDAEPEQDEQAILKVLTPLVEALPPKQAAALTAKITGCKKKVAYDLAIGLKK